MSFNITLPLKKKYVKLVFYENDFPLPSLKGINFEYDIVGMCLCSPMKGLEFKDILNFSPREKDMVFNNYITTQEYASF